MPVQMDVVPGTPAKYRAPHPDAPVLQLRTEFVERAIPNDRAALWMPIEQPTGRPVYPIMIAQRVLSAVHAHLATRSEGASSFGFLVGDVHTAPDTGLPYVIAEATVDVPWSIAGGHLKSALLQGREIAEAEARRRGGQLVGWYHCQIAADARLSVADVEAHLACFDEPWQVALVVARGMNLMGGVFRVPSHTSGATRGSEYLPFYEVPEGDDSARLAWANYRLHGVGVPATVAPTPLPGAQQLVLLPDASDLDDELDFRPPAPAPLWRFRLTPALRNAAFTALGVATVSVLYGGYRVIAGDGGPSEPAPAAVAASAGLAVRGLADSTALSISAFSVRARLFEGRKMVCADLARGLIEVEERWTAYVAARAVASFDAAQRATDQRLHDDVAAVEQRFGRTGCPRP